jgi:hypothetical protein
VGVVDDPVEVDGREDIALVTEFSITTKGADVAGQLVTRALLAVEEAILAVVLEQLQLADSHISNACAKSSERTENRVV